MRKPSGILTTIATAIGLLTLGSMPAQAAAPVSTGCYLYNDGSGAEIDLDQFLGQAVDDVMDDYQVVIDGTPRPVTFARTYNSRIILLFSQRITTATSSASLSHHATSNGSLKNGSGEYIADFSCNLDLRDLGPTVQSVTTNSTGSQIIATATGAIDSTDFFVRRTDSWDVSVGGTQVPVSSVSIVGTTITLELGRTLGYGETAVLHFFGGPAETYFMRMGSIPAFWSTEPLNVNSLAPAPGPNVTPTAPDSASGTLATVTKASASSVAPGESLELIGVNLIGVTSLKVGAIDLEILARSDEAITVRIPEGLSMGSKDLTVVTAAGQTIAANLFSIVEAGPSMVPAGFSSIKRVGNSVRLFVLNPEGLGKVQFKINGREIAWVRAVDASDPKLRNVTGRAYFVRNANLKAGKNAIEIFIDGKRVKRNAYTR